MTELNPQIVEALLGLICCLIVWVVYSVHNLKVEFTGMKTALDVRVKDADADHARYDDYAGDLEDIRIRVTRLEDRTDRNMSHS